MKPTLIPELKVSDFKISLDFYTSIIGFDIIYERVEDDFAMLEMNGAQIMIEGISSSTRMWEVGELNHPFGRGINLQIEVKDLSSIYSKVKAKSYPVFHEIEIKWYRIKEEETGNKQFLIQDPDGYLLRFYEDLGKRQL